MAWKATGPGIGTSLRNRRGDEACFHRSRRPDGRSGCASGCRLEPTHSLLLGRLLRRNLITVFSTVNTPGEKTFRTRSPRRRRRRARRASGTPRRSIAHLRHDADAILRNIFFCVVCLRTRNAVHASTMRSRARRRIVATRPERVRNRASTDARSPPGFRVAQARMRESARTSRRPIAARIVSSHRRRTHPHVADITARVARTRRPPLRSTTRRARSNVGPTPGSTTPRRRHDAAADPRGRSAHPCRRRSVACAPGDARRSIRIGRSPVGISARRTAARHRAHTARRSDDPDRHVARHSTRSVRARTTGWKLTDQDVATGMRRWAWIDRNRSGESLPVNSCRKIPAGAFMPAHPSRRNRFGPTRIARKKSPGGGAADIHRRASRRSRRHTAPPFVGRDTRCRSVQWKEEKRRHGWDRVRNQGRDRNRN